MADEKSIELQGIPPETKNISQASEGVEMSAEDASAIEEFLNARSSHDQLKSNYDQLKENILELLFLKLHLTKKKELGQWETHIKIWLTDIYKKLLPPKIFPQFFKLLLHATQNNLGMSPEEIKKLFLSLIEEVVRENFSVGTVNVEIDAALAKIAKKYSERHTRFAASLALRPTNIHNQDLTAVWIQVNQTAGSAARSLVKWNIIPAIITVILLLINIFITKDFAMMFGLTIITTFLFIQPFIRTWITSVKESAETTRKDRLDAATRSLKNSLAIKLQQNKILNNQVICTLVPDQNIPEQSASINTSPESTKGFAQLLKAGWSHAEIKADQIELKRNAAVADAKSLAAPRSTPNNTPVIFSQRLSPHAYQAYYDPDPKNEAKCTIFPIRNDRDKKTKSYIFISPGLEGVPGWEKFQSLSRHTKKARDESDQGIKRLKGKKIMDPITKEYHPCFELEALNTESSGERLVGTFVMLTKPNGDQHKAYVFNTFWDSKHKRLPEQLSESPLAPSKPAARPASVVTSGHSFTAAMGRNGSETRQPKQEQKKNSKR